MFRLFKLFVCLFLCGAVVAFCFALGGGTAFAEGETYTFYCGGASSSAQIVTCEKNAGLVKLFLCDVRGESTVYQNADVAALEQEYRATLLWQEECAGVVSRYYSSPCFSQSVYIGGQEVNLHIAVRGDTVCVGTPLIFGGY